MRFPGGSGGLWLGSHDAHDGHDGGVCAGQGMFWLLTLLMTAGHDGSRVVTLCSGGVRGVVWGLRLGGYSVCWVTERRQTFI